ncbi:hypothetical protein [Couchioplanes azureus]|uniref:hypothetical protein n=1 Tax=Couchioplanes caeruleus TaxID=56438 RepID=UPI00166F7B1B|nr:hypothetical protein [Couchioplanes caeruleus]
MGLDAELGFGGTGKVVEPCARALPHSVFVLRVFHVKQRRHAWRSGSGVTIRPATFAIETKE